MNARPTPVILMLKALRACASARALLDLNDVDGACSRAYYAMFDAARASLLVTNPQQTPRTHSGLMSAFGMTLVKSGVVDREFGRALKRAEEIRIVADYRGDSVELVDALDLVEQAEAFVLAMQVMFVPELSRRSGH